jgi:DNA segregation ATPase FtsK/SpoIIIE, S-DNA-T family
MEFVFDDGVREHDRVLIAVDPGAKVSDLAAAVGADPFGLTVDGRFVPGAVGLRASGIGAGSVVRPASAALAALAGTPEPAALEVRVVGGLDAGAVTPLTPVGLPIGRAAAGGVTIALPEISAYHAAITVAPDGTPVVRDTGSRNGLDVNGRGVDQPTAVGEDDVIGIGGAALLRVLTRPTSSQYAKIDVVHGARHGWRVPFHRSARPTPPTPAVLTVPAAGEPPLTRGQFLLAGILGPVLMAAATVWIFQNIRFALFVLISPLTMAVSGLERRLRGRRTRKQGRRALQAGLRAFDSALAAEHLRETARRRDVGADPAEVVFRATAPGARLWERRARDRDFLVLTVASGDQPWHPELAGVRDGEQPRPEVAERLAWRAELARVPVTVDLAEAPVLGIEGPYPCVLAAARSLLCQAAVVAGPADLAIAVFTHAPSAADWEWSKWLPHTLDRGQGVTRMLARGRTESDILAAELLAGHPFPTERGPRRGMLLVVVGGASLLEGRICPLRELLSGRAGHTAGLIVADPLPAACEAVLTVRADGAGRLRHVASGTRQGSMLVSGLSETRARGIARALARFEDPETALAGAGLPGRVPLLPLLALPSLGPQAILERWRDGARTARARAVIGVGESGPYNVDLDDDGPHGLIAGATGSGKSELLRTLILSLAAGSDPDHLVFVLVDGKGGAAMDEFARLPHVVGITTDLDKQLSLRALRCLEAELRHREEQLRRLAVPDFHAYQRRRRAAQEAGPSDAGSPPGPPPLPRMLVIVDEYATLAKKVPEFIDALLDVAQRGRSLGVHLILATQRPAGSVSEAIKANVKLRIALRTESPEDSTDVIDTPAAYQIGPTQWGRAFRRVGGGEVEAVQTALAGATTDLEERKGGVQLGPFPFGRKATEPEEQEPAAAGGRTDLERLIEAMTAAFAQGGFAAPRKPWPEPLPACVPLDESLSGPADAGMQTPAAGLPAFLLADDPDRQQRLTLGWDPRAGNLLVYGTVGSGTSTALASALLAWARSRDPEQLRLFVFDFGSGVLAPFERLQHTGAYATAGDRERLIRLVNLLTKELARRSSSGGRSPLWLVAVDAMAALRAAFDEDPLLAALLPKLDQVYADGPAVGIAFAVGADRVGAVPAAIAARTAQRLVLSLAEPGEYGLLGVRPGVVPRSLPGRGVVAATGQEVQVALPGAYSAPDCPATSSPHLVPGFSDLASVGPVAEAVKAVHALWAAYGTTGSAMITSMPESFTLSDLGVKPSLSASPWKLPVGLAQESLEPAFLPVYEHDHLLIAGPRRSGRSTLLCLLAGQLAQAVETGDLEATIIAYAPRASALRDIGGPVQQASDYEHSHQLIAACHPQSPPILLVDDGDTVDDIGAYRALIGHRNPAVHVIAAARTDGPVRSGAHWLGALRRSRTGILLNPDFAVDGDLLAVALPRRTLLAPAPGRGYLVADGRFLAIQGATL